MLVDFGQCHSQASRECPDISVAEGMSRQGLERASDFIWSVIMQQYTVWAWDEDSVLKVYKRDVSFSFCAHINFTKEAFCHWVTSTSIIEVLTHPTGNLSKNKSSIETNIRI